MKRFPWLLLLAASLPLLPAPARAVQVQIDSPDKNTTWPWATAIRRDLRWSEKDHALLAVVTFDNSLHADSTTPQAQEDLYFTFPGTTLDPADNTVGVAAPDGSRIVIGEWRKAFLGRRLSLYQNTLIIVHKLRGAISLTLDVDTERKAEDMRKKQDEEETQNISLDQMIHPQN